MAWIIVCGGGRVVQSACAEVVFLNRGTRRYRQTHGHDARFSRFLFGFRCICGHVQTAAIGAVDQISYSRLGSNLRVSSMCCVVPARSNTQEDDRWWAIMAASGSRGAAFIFLCRALVRGGLCTQLASIYGGVFWGWRGVVMSPCSRGVQGLHRGGQPKWSIWT